MNKKLFVSTICLIFTISNGFSQFATDVTVTDCKNNAYNLFNELDAGKIIVIGWAMPCSSCASPLLDVHNAILNFEISNPGVVKYWICDDFGNTSCSSLTNWALNNGMNNALNFSSSLIDMGDYGADGMPKVVVLGCSSHKVYYNVNDNPTGSGVTTAINQALAELANSCVTGLEKVEYDEKSIELYPNPVLTKCSFQIENPKDIESILITSASGTKIVMDEWDIENGQVVLNTENLTGGIYFLTVQTIENTFVTRFEKIK